MATFFKDISLPGIEIVPCRLNGPRGIVKAFVLHDDDHVVLIDTGYSEEDVPEISKALGRIDRSLNDVSSLILTHRHNDHVGGLKKILSLVDIPTYAHPDEIGPIQAKIGIEIDNPVNDGEVLNLLDGLRVIHMPGHTSGNIGLYWKSKSTFMAGDSIFSAGEALIVSPPFASMDPEQARASVGRLMQMELDIDAVFVAHGEDVKSDAKSALLRIFQERRLHP